MRKRAEILNTALQLFNERGIQDVKTREIAKLVKISVGNLTYYFPTKNDIVYALWLQLAEEVESSAVEMHNSSDRDTLASLYQTVKTIFKIQLNYKFIFIYRYAILSSLQELQNYYRKVLKSRFEFSIQQYEQLINEGFLQKSLAKEINGFLYLVNILGSSWQQEITIYFPNLSDEEKIEHGLAIFFHLYKPYLTEKGASVLKPLIKDLEPYNYKPVIT